MKPTPNSQPVARAIELAERILNEVTRPQQDWRAVRSIAISLARLADRESGRIASPDDPTGERREPGSPRP